jgi:hypothetical protein
LGSDLGGSIPTSVGGGRALHQRVETGAPGPTRLEVRMTPPGDEQAFASTSMAWEWVKIARPPKATRHSAPKGLRWFRLPRRDARRPLPLTIKLRGGPECWVEVHSRGSMGRFPGWVTLYDVLREINRL